MEMRFDAQVTSTFVLAQATYIEQQVYQVQYADIQYPKLIDIDTSAPAWTKSVTYFSMDGVGQMQWMNTNAHDVARADLLRSKQETRVHLGALGYGFDYGEIEYAKLLGINLESDKALLCRRLAEEFVDSVVQTGVAPDGTSVGFTGLINNTTVTSSVAPADGTGGLTTFASKTPAMIVRDLNGLLSGIANNSLQIEKADTMLLPYSTWQYLAQVPYQSNSSNESILAYFLRTNVWTVETGNPLKMLGILRLETAGAGGTKRILAYRKDPTVVKLHLPMPFGFFPPWQTGPMRWDVPGALRMGGVDFRRPAAARYLDGI